MSKVIDMVSSDTSFDTIKTKDIIMWGREKKFSPPKIGDSFRVACFIGTCVDVSDTHVAMIVESNGREVGIYE